MISISRLENNKVPIAEVTVRVEKATGQMKTLSSLSKSKIIILNSKVKNHVKLELVKTELVGASKLQLPGKKVGKSYKLLNEPDWAVHVQLGNAEGVKNGDEIILNVLTVFHQAPINFQGEWVFPVMVESDEVIKADYALEDGEDIKTDEDGVEKNYLIAYVKVKVNWE